jgi:hypothetical protein
MKIKGGGGARVAGVAYTMLMTTHDELVTPYASGFMSGAKNIVLQDLCPQDRSDHLGMAYDSVVHHLVLNALDPAHASRVSCANPLLTYFR